MAESVITHSSAAGDSHARPSLQTRAGRLLELPFRDLRADDCPAVKKRIAKFKGYMAWFRKNGYWVFALLLLGLVVFLVRTAKLP